MDQDIKDIIDQIKSYYAIQSFSLYCINHPGIKNIINQEFDDPNATSVSHRKDGSEYPILLHPSLKECCDSKNFNLFTLRSIGFAITLVFDEMEKKHLIDSSPELQFLRHLRNSQAHGNRFYLKGGEPKNPAKFNNKFEIFASMDGMQNVLFDFIYPGDIFDLFDHIKKL